MVIVSLKDGREFEAPKDNVPNIKRLFFGEIKMIKPKGFVEKPSQEIIGSSIKDLNPPKKGRPKTQPIN